MATGTGDAGATITAAIWEYWKESIDIES